MSGIALLFPGQGSQYVGMGKEFYSSFPQVKTTFEEASDLLGIDVASLCFESSIEYLTQTQNAQLAIYTYSVALFRLLIEEFAIVPSVLAGHSLGEFSALTCAEALSFNEGLQLVNDRGRLMKNVSQQNLGTMRAVFGLNREMIEEICQICTRSDELVVVANLNSDKQVVISGHLSAIEACTSMLQKQGATIFPLNVSAAFHSPLMEPIADHFRHSLEQVSFKPTKWPVISNVTAENHIEHHYIDCLTKQIVSPVRWIETMEKLASQNIHTIIEVGPKDILKKLIKSQSVDVDAYALDYQEDYDALMEKTLEAARPTKEKLKELIIRCMGIAVCTRNTNWEQDDYAGGVVQPYRNLEQLLKQVEANDITDFDQHIRAAIKHLDMIFKTKCTSLIEQQERYEFLYKHTQLSEVLHKWNEVMGLNSGGETDC
jgi:[acyl-carrier-protein] S-malonyltransferase